MSKGVGQPGHRVRYRPGEVRTSRRGRRIRGVQELFVGITRTAYWTGLALLVSYALYQSYVLIYETSYLRLENVLVMGNSVLQKADIVSMTGIELGSHFFKYRPKEIRAVLLQHPRVREASVEQLSPKTLAIQIVENRAAFRTIVSDQVLEVGEDGRILGAAATAATTLPLLLGLPEDKPDERGNRRIAPEVFAQIPSWLSALKGSFLADFESVDFQKPFRVEVRWRGRRVHLGEPADIHEMESHARATLADAQRRRVGIGQMDLRFHMLVVKYESTPATTTGTWTTELAALAPLPLATGPTAIATVAEAATAASTELVPLTAHPDVLAAALPADSSTGPQVTTTATFDDQELMALAADPSSSVPPESKPAFDSSDESEEAPDPAYIYNPPAVPRDDDEEAAAPGRSGRPHADRPRSRRSPSEESGGGN